MSVFHCKNISATTGWGVKREIDIIIEEFAIREKLVRIDTDNGSNMVKVGTLLFLVVKMKSETDTEGEFTSSEDELDTYFNISEIDLLQDSGLMHIRCFAHSLQLVKDFASYLAEKKYNSIPKPIKVRWNSELKFLKAICQIKLIDLNEALNLINNQRLNLSQNQNSRLAEKINILEPLELSIIVTNKIQGDQYSTLSLLVPKLLQLIQHLDDF
ncbi:zinc finger BED domain-containing 1-like [Brachionus plicatilis]|uniref:Zinc finger BED domain-containing 1-like n=1 Tax=Brachionus plicatilis TaxID=10195 RepID=A0A3M7RG24_BRAPC|nr:zinc finger BED domain-containing 1-like [Brachionus plicatilis]